MLPFGRLWYNGPNAVANAIGYAKRRSRSHDAVIRAYDDAGNVIETHELERAIQRTGERGARQRAAYATTRDGPLLRHNVEAQLSSPARI